MTGVSALHLASERGLACTVAKLLSLGADAALKDSYGNTALMPACANGHEAAAAEVMEATKLAGALDVQDRSRGRTALHMASGKGLAGTVAKLLSLGANAALKDSRGDTALQNVARWDNLPRHTNPYLFSRFDEVKAVFAEHATKGGQAEQS